MARGVLVRAAILFIIRQRFYLFIYLVVYLFLWQFYEASVAAAVLPNHDFFLGGGR